MRRYSVFDCDADYFNDVLDEQLIRKTAKDCYLPANALLLDLCRRHEGRFRVAFGVSGTALEQMERYVPDALNGFRALAETGCVEFLAETYYHSLASLFSETEFREQVSMHRSLIERLFGTAPRTFRNAEMIYSNAIGEQAAALGFRTALVEGSDGILGRNNAGTVFRAPAADIALLARHYRLTDDLTLRFGDAAWSEHPLTAEKFAGWMHAMPGPGCNLFTDYESFGEQQTVDTGIFEFLRALPDAVLKNGDRFITPDQRGQPDPRDTLDVPGLVSWTLAQRNVAPWLGNGMQASAAKQLYGLEQAVKESGNASLLESWRRLTAGDHLFCMCTQEQVFDRKIRRYQNPYESPYDCYIHFMNILDNLQGRVGGAEPRLRTNI